MYILAVFGLPATAGVARTETASRAPVSKTDAAHHHRLLLLFTRQIRDSDTDPCWELVVSDARENHAHVVAGPYPRSVWDDHFIGNWAPDGRSVIFMADLGTGQAIWRVRTDGTHLHKVFSPPNDGTGLDDGPAFTPDGRHIIFTRCCPDVSGYALWSITPNGQNLKQVTSEVAPPGVDGPSDNLPQVSPNGLEVAYHRNVVDSATEPPDGHIIFGHVTDDGGRDLYIMRTDGSHPRLIKATADLERFPHVIQRRGRTCD
jgi:hypothetical protein